MLDRARSFLAAFLFALVALAAGPATADPLDDARADYEAMVEAYGAESPDALIAEWDLALMLDQAGELAEAEGHWRHMAATAEPLGEDSSLLAQIRLRLAMNQVKLGGYEEAVALNRAGLPVMLAEVGPDHEIVRMGRMSLATAHMMLGQYEEAEIPARACVGSRTAW